MHRIALRAGIASGLLCVVADATLTGGQAVRSEQHPRGPALTRPSPRASGEESYGRLPLSFERNEGQTDARVKFLSRGRGYHLFLCSTEAVLSLRRGGAGPRPPGFPGRRGEERATEAAVVRMKLVGGNPDPEVWGSDPLPGKSNYFTGNDPRRWRTEIPHYARVRYREVYPGVDVVYYGNEGELEYDFVVAPGGDPGSIRLSFEGADQVRRDQAGNLVLEIDGSRVVHHAPAVHQEREGERRRVAGAYVLHGEGQVGFRVGEYDTTRPLVIDPVLVYSTYLGGSDEDDATDIAVDASGSAYVTGRTASTDFPTVNPFPAPQSGGVFVTKLSPDGGSLVYSTYLGGGTGLAVAVDDAGSAYVTGATSSTDFPTVNPFQATLGGGSDAFVTKLSPAGSSLVYSTYLGGADYDDAWGVAVDGAGSAYVVGQTFSADFPTMNPLQPAKGGEADGFVAKLSPGGSTLDYSTFLGGGGSEIATAVALDGSGSSHVTGLTSSMDFPTQGPYQADQGGVDAFVTKLAPAGSSLAYSTYLGGGDVDIGYAIAVDGAGSAHVAGVTSSSDFPTLNPYQTDQPDGDAFVTKLAPDGAGLEYSTYLGGSGSDLALGIGVDGVGSIYVAGYTSSQDFPVFDAFQSGLRGLTDGFVTKVVPPGGGKVAAKGSSLRYSTYVGGSGDELLYNMALHGSGDVYVTGWTQSADFPTLDPYQAALRSARDAFVTRLGTPPPLAFYTLTPCRAVDTRTLSAPALTCSSAPTPRTFSLAGSCLIPSDARAVSYNLAVTQATAAGHLRLFPAGSPTPFSSAVNYAANATRANNGVVRLSAGDLSVSCHQASGSAHVIIDVNGYFK